MAMETLPIPEFGERICTDCHQRLPLCEFYSDRRTRLGVSGPCKQCANKRSTEWSKRNPEKRLDTHLRRQFGITLEQYLAMEAEQGGVCAICGQPPTAQTSTRQRHSARPRLAVDHDHATGRVRGLLCELCNCGIGMLKDDPAIVRFALKYLEERA